MDGRDYIYIGKGRPISGRLKSHFKEANKKASKSRGEDWNEFFGKKKYRKELIIRWIELDYDNKKKKIGDLFREAIESYLSDKFKVKFDKMRNKRKQQKRAQKMGGKKKN